MEDCKCFFERCKCLVHPCIFNKDQLPKGIKDFNELLNVFYFQLGVDGVFAGYPGLLIQFLKNPNYI